MYTVSKEILFWDVLEMNGVVAKSVLTCFACLISGDHRLVKCRKLFCAFSISWLACTLICLSWQMRPNLRQPSYLMRKVCSWLSLFGPKLHDCIIHFLRRRQNVIYLFKQFYFWRCLKSKPIDRLTSSIGSVRCKLPPKLNSSLIINI